MKRHRLYSSTEAAMDALIGAVAGAERSIYWESYIFRNDMLPTHDFFLLFKKKAAAGVKVVIILDGLGGYDFDRKELSALRNAGVEVYFFGNWLRRTHRKLLIVDDTIGFIGGVNVGHAYRKWLDLHMRVTGPLLPALIHSFAKSYAMCGGTDVSVLKERNTQRTVRATKLWLVEHWPVFNRLRLRDYYESKIGAAEKSISMISPYFIPHTWMRRALLKAVLRGVTVEIIIPEHTDPPLADIPNYYNADDLGSYGVHFFLTKKMNHAKALLIDDREGLIGSQNIDAYSFDFNQEAGVSFTKKDMVRDLKKIILEWKKESIPFSDVTWKRKWYYPVVALIVRIIQPFT